MAADLPARRGADSARAMAALLGWCEGRRAAAATAAAAAVAAPSSSSFLSSPPPAPAHRRQHAENAENLWSSRCQACEWALARLHVASPATCRAWARAALERRARAAPSPTHVLISPSWTPPPGLDPAALAAAARLEAATGDVTAAKRLFAAAAAAGAPPADAARASALLRFCGGDPARAAAAFAGAAEGEGGAGAIDSLNEALCRLHAGDTAGATAAVLAPYLAPGAASVVSPDALAEAALRAAATVADLAPPSAARAVRARLAAAVAAAGPPDDLDVSVLAVAGGGAG